MISKESAKNLSSLGSLTKTFMEMKQELKNPEVQKRFAGNVFLLMGHQQISISKLAELSRISLSTMSRLLSGKMKTKFENTNPLTFAVIALSLGVDANTLLFVDLREKFTELLANLKP